MHKGGAQLRIERREFGGDVGTWYRPLLPPRWIPALRRHQQQVQVCAHLFPSGCPPPRLHREKSKFPSQVPKFSSHDEFPRKASDRENVPTSYPHLVTCAFLSCAGSSPRTPPRTSCASPTFSPSPRSTCFAAFSPLLPPRGSHGKSWRIWSKSGSANPPAMRPTPPPVPPLMTTRLPLDPREEPREET